MVWITCVKDDASTDSADSFQCDDGQQFPFYAFRNPFNQFVAQCGDISVFGDDWREFVDGVQEPFGVFYGAV